MFRFKIAHMVVRTRFRELSEAKKETRESFIFKDHCRWWQWQVAVASNVEGAYRVSVVHAEPRERDNTKRVKVNYKMLIFFNYHMAVCVEVQVA